MVASQWERESKGLQGRLRGSGIRRGVSQYGGGKNGESESSGLWQDCKSELRSPVCGTLDGELLSNLIIKLTVCLGVTRLRQARRPLSTETAKLSTIQDFNWSIFWDLIFATGFSVAQKYHVCTKLTSPKTGKKLREVKLNLRLKKFKWIFRGNAAYSRDQLDITLTSIWACAYRDASIFHQQKPVIGQ